MKLGWYLHRIQAMSGREILHRIAERFSIWVEKLSMPWLDSRGNKKRLPEGSYLSFVNEGEGRFFFAWDDRKKHQEYNSNHYSSGGKATLSTVGDLLEHKFSIFQKQFELTDKIDWHRDPLTGRSWPAKFWADIDTRDGQTVGGVKWVWELNRHQHLVTLAKAYFLFGDERYANEVRDQILDWINANPYLRGINWTSPLEISIRILNWTWALAFIRRSPAMTEDAFTKILLSIGQQASHIAHHLSAFSSANNHLIGEAAGLAFVSMVFPWLHKANIWRSKAMLILTSEIGKQICEDGVPAEQSIHYLIFILDFYILVGELGKINNVPIPQIWYNRLFAAYEFLVSILDENDNFPQIGDSDDASVLRLDDCLDANEYRSILSGLTVFLGLAKRREIAGGWDEKNHWLFGEKGNSRYQSTEVDSSPRQSNIFPQGGYAILRAPGRVISFDFAPLGYLATASHGHADALSIWVHINGKPLLVDSGTFAYQEGSLWRDYFRSTRAHNTVEIDGLEQSEMRGTFLWGRKAACELHHWEFSAEYDWVIASHEGYKQIGIHHKRSVIFLKPDCLCIMDDLLGIGLHGVKQYWHFPANAAYEMRGDCQIVSLETQKVQIFRLDDHASQTSFHYGNMNPIQGWISPYYGLKYRSPVLEYSLQAELPVKLITLINFSPKNEMGELLLLKEEILKIIDRINTT